MSAYLEFIECLNGRLARGRVKGVGGGGGVQENEYWILLYN